MSAHLDIAHDVEPFAAYFLGERGATPSGNLGWYLFDCPFCGKDGKHAVHFGHRCCKCWSCGYKRGMFQFIMDAERLSFRDVRQRLQSGQVGRFTLASLKFGPQINETIAARTSEVRLPGGYCPLFATDTDLGARALSYLTGRGLDPEALAMLGVGFCDAHDPDRELDRFGYLIIPFKRDGLLLYWHARAFLGQEPKYKNPATETFGVGKSSLLYNQDVLMLEERVYIMEGVISSWAAPGMCGVALGGNTMSEYQRWRMLNSPVEELVVCLDPGTRQQSFGIAYDLMEYKQVKVLLLEGGDPAELGSEYLQRLYEDTPYIDSTNIFSVLGTDW